MSSAGQGQRAYKGASHSSASTLLVAVLLAGVQRLRLLAIRYSGCGCIHTCVHIYMCVLGGGGGGGGSTLQASEGVPGKSGNRLHCGRCRGVGGA
jgi:hypothetical protein